jgi:DNA (cytosine-5)-methyltransferase 1
MDELALFAGAGGGILGGKLLDWNTVCAVEIEEYPRKVLLQRQRDGILGEFPIWDDITTFDGRPWRGAVDVISGGFPCQDISAAGKGAGIDGERSGLWREMARVVDEVRPRFVFVENSPMLTSRGLGAVLGDLAAMGYDARWCVLGADDAGAPHRRKRIWILAYPGNREGRDGISRSAGRNGLWELDEAKRTPEAVETSGPGKASEVVADTDKIRCDNRSDIRQERYVLSTEQRGLEKGKPERNGRELRACSYRSNENMADTDKSYVQGNQRSDIDPEGWQEQGGRPARSCGISRSIEWWGEDPADIPNADSTGLWEQSESELGGNKKRKPSTTSSEQRGKAEPELGRVVNGMADRVDRLKAIGNGQVPAVAAIAFTILSEGLT